MKRQKVVVLSGPTASGKSTAAIGFAKQFGGEVVNADSVSIYKGFSIGSGKPEAQELVEVPHHLVSLLEPTQVVSAGLFRELAGEVIQDIGSRGALPLVVGGTGLYINALLCGLISTADESGQKQLESLEAELEAQAEDEEERRALLYQELLERDAKAAALLEPRDEVRVKRALRVLFEEGVSIATLRASHEMSDYSYEALVIIRIPEREELYRRCDARVDEMFKRGVVEEVRGLLREYGRDLHPLRSIGYRTIVQFLDGAIAETECLRLIKRDTRRFAKRQCTWWRNQPEKLGWRELKNNNKPEQITREFLVATEPQALEPMYVLQDGLWL